MPQMPHRTVTLDFSPEGYPGFSADAWITAPISKTDLLAKTVDEDEARKLLLELIPSWEFYDEVGEPVPHTVEALDSLPRHLVVMLIKKYQLAISGVDPDFGKASPSTSVAGKP